MRKLRILEQQPLIIEKPSKVAIFRQPSPLDSFSTEELETPSGKITFVSTEISLLLNQQRLMQLNPMILQDWLSSARSSGIDTTGMTDDQLISALKSRYIQSNADVYHYTQALQRDLDTAIDDIKQQYESQLAAQQATQQQQDTTSGD